MLFSQRIGKKPVKTALQIDDIDGELRNRLWDCLDMFFWQKCDNTYTPHCNLYPVFTAIWHRHFKTPIDTIEDRSYKAINYIRRYFFSSAWYDVYEFIEFMESLDYRNFSPTGKFADLCNVVLEQEKSCYRFIEGIISPINSEIEIKAIVESVNSAEKIGLRGVSTQLKSALIKLSDRKTPDYRNSIKESISAVESIAISISEDTKASLPDALKNVEKKIGLNPALKSAFSTLYGYTSTSDGIRHALLEEANIDFDDAKYMLVSCSAFINYLISKCAKKGIKLS